MNKNNIGLFIMFLGGLGLGLLLGVEFSYQYTTIIGSVLLLISIGSTILFSLKIENKMK
jgi:hypothetical protein